MFTTDINAAITHAANVAYPLFQLYGWTYGNRKKPDVRELEHTITYLVQKCEAEAQKEEDGHFTSISTGRFIVTRREDDGEVTYRIALDLAEAVVSDLDDLYVE